MAGQRPWSAVSVAVVLTIVSTRNVQATPGRVGCFYDLQLCERSELCYNDSLFGTCISQLSDAINYNDLEPNALNKAAQILQYLIETGHKWQDSYTQCVVGKYLQSVITQENYNPEVCEYLRAILDVIDQNKGASSQQATGTAALPPVDGPVSHGEFLSKSDGKDDFDSVAPDAQPAQSPSSPIDINDPEALAALQQYVAANYQQASNPLQQQQSQPDNVNVEKKSAPEATTVSPSTLPTTTLETTTTTVDNLAADGNFTAEDAEAIQRLFAMVNSVPPSEDQLQQAVMVGQNPELTAVPEGRFYDVVPFNSGPRMPEMIPVFGNEIMSNGPQSLQFNDMSGIQFVPDFSVPPPLEMLSPMDRMFLAQQMQGPQFNDPRMMQQIDPRMLPQMDPRMMPMDPQMMPPMMPRMDDQMFMQQGPPPQFMAQPPQFPVMDARAVMGPGFGMDPAILERMSGMGPMGQPGPMDMMGVPMKRGPRMDIGMMSPMEQMMMAQHQMGPQMGFPMGMDPRMSPQFQNMPDRMGPIYQQNMPDPALLQMLMQNDPSLFNQFPPQGPPPMQRNPFGQDPWTQVPMDFPPNFPSFQSQPQLSQAYDSPKNATEDEMIAKLFAEAGEQSMGTDNASSDLKEQSKKDQEYKTLLPSDENLDAEVVEDVTVKVVKGGVTESTTTRTVVKEADDGADDDAATEDDYVFIMTDPQLNIDESRYFLNWLAAVMSLPSETFYDISVNDDLVTFRINPAFQKLNATYIAQSLGDEELRRALRQANGLELLRVGVGHYSLVENSQLMASEPEIRFQQTAVVQAEPQSAGAQTDMRKKYDVLDPTFAFIDVNEPQLTYDKARRILNWLAVKLQVPQTVFSNLHIEGNQLVFRVSPYFNKINATYVSEQLANASIQAELKSEFGIDITKSGIGDKVQVVKADNKQHQTLLIGLIAVACVACLLIVLGIIYLVRRNMLMRNKLAGLDGDVESSKEYEELCRQRMASKNLESINAGILGASPEKGAAHDRTTHSSTSSWSEEPAPSNMDITTGHMVLSYMEDHLKHKERLNEEWASLCTYEADPSKADAAAQKENLIKNRYPDVLPYDHTRVKLNPDLNDTKSDYINANLITDADPKNPSYIATQGPLPETVSDFWQMVWEKNSTVIVMLTKLREGDQDLCHIYWPKEGSEVYANFEVHLVSEHIWNDDYLVRNFYLKNLKTHETRTVTQFHYLNWPNLGVPSSLKTFLEFRRKINKCYKGGSSPIVVVCSDGVDRTGAYCLIDLVLNRMAKGVKEIDIAATLEHLRDQRMDMVRTKDQFEFVLTAVAQEIQAILKSIPQK